MPAKTSIEWTEATWNPVTGCSKVSDGCRFCYAERLSHRFGRTTKPWTHPHAGANVTLHPYRLDEPLKWRKPRRVFVCSMADLFHELVPDDFLASVFAVMALAQAHTFQVLTKRPERMRQLATDPRSPGRVNMAAELRTGQTRAPSWPTWPLPNVWLGTSVEDQRAADERIPHLVATPAAVRFLSCEPLLGPIDLSAWLWEEAGAAWAGKNPSPDIGWVIAGGESGGPAERRLTARCELATMDRVCKRCGGTGWQPTPEALRWVRSLRDQCVDALCPFFFKQWGGSHPKQGGRLLDGREWSQFPEVIAS